MAHVSLKILDDQNGQPFPCWVNLTKLAGENLAPTGWLPEFPTAPGADVGGRVVLGGQVWFAISGECELPGNQGECVLKVSRAPGFCWTDHQVNLFAGRLAVRLSVPIPQSGAPDDFISADLRSHSVSAGVAMMEARAGGLQVVQVLASQFLPGDPLKTNLAPLTEAFGLKALVLENGCLVSWGTLNVQEDSGNLALLDCHRPVFPLVIDQTNVAAWSVMDWAAQCHRVRGLTVWADYGREHGHQSEVICAALEGEIDCFEVVDLCEKRPGGLALWYAMAGAGIFLPLVGASAKDSNTVPIGSLRTLLPVQGNGKSFSNEAKAAQTGWVEGIKSGCLSVTRWPFVFTREIQAESGFCKVTTEIGPLIEPMMLEWVQPNGQVVLSKELLPTDVNQLVSGDLLGPLPCRLAARMRNQKGELVAHESFHRVCHQEDERPELDFGMTRQLVDRLSAGIQKMEQAAGTETKGELLYRKDLFAKWLAKLLNREVD